MLLLDERFEKNSLPKPAKGVPYGRGCSAAL